MAGDEGNGSQTDPGDMGQNETRQDETMRITMWSSLTIAFGAAVLLCACGSDGTTEEP
jgi:hypothetical protein